MSETEHDSATCDDDACGICWVDWDLLTPEQQREINDAPCRMMHQPPMDFAFCETHDTTFALGDVCRYQKATR